MDILGIGPLELVVILIVAMLVFGPDPLPAIGAKLGRAVRDMRRTTRELARELGRTAQEDLHGPQPTHPAGAPAGNPVDREV